MAVRARAHALALVVVASGALDVALYLQYGQGLEPCHLCVLQRIPYGVAMLFALMTLATDGPRRMRGFLLLVAALCFAVDAGLAAYHVGVERHWWESACSGGGTGLAGSAADLLAQLSRGAHPVACDAVSWSLFGMSLAGYNLITALLLALYAGWAGGRALEER